MAKTTISALPAAVSLVLYEGDDFFLDLTVSNVDGTPASLVGFTARSQIRATANDETVLAELITSIVDNVITLHLPGAESAGLATDKAVWDVQITDAAGWVTTLAYGTVTITQEVTRS